MLGALGSADKYSTASVTHTTGLSWHCWIQILQNWPPAPRSSPSTPTESLKRWLGGGMSKNNLLSSSALGDSWSICSDVTPKTVLRAFKFNFRRNHPTLKA